MANDINGQPSDANDYDGSHISKPIREALKDQPPEIAAGVRRVADQTEQQRENGTGRPAMGTPARRR